MEGDLKAKLEALEAEHKNLDRDFNEMRLFHRDVVNEMKHQGLVLTELKDYVKQLAEFKSEVSTSIKLANEMLSEHKKNETETFKRVFSTIEDKYGNLNIRLLSLESDRKWLVRIVMGVIVLSLLYLLGLKGH